MTIHTYLHALQTNLDSGAATEHTHRTALQALLNSLLSDCQAINEPRRTEAGAVDFEIRRDEVQIGWLETKDIGANLDKIQDSAQIQRYRKALHNFILTNYVEFRYFYYGELQPDMTVRIAELAPKQKSQIFENAFSKLEALFIRFGAAQVVTLNNPQELAQHMADIARLIIDLTLSAYQKEAHNGFLHQQLDSFRAVLLDELKPEEFADMYAQTVCYGLFAAKCTLIGEKLSRYNAAHSIPKTNPFLRHLFDQIAGIDMDDRLIWAVEHLITVLNHTDIAAILEDFGKRTRQEDPVVHFYETFLATYNPTLREVRGVYYTPEPVVSYIVRSLDNILTSHFGLKDGLACKEKLDSGLHKVQILDPATGTGTFLYFLFNLIYQRFLYPINKKGMWSSYVTKDLLPRVHGFEFLMAPYTVAHMKLGLQLQETGYEFNSDERLRLFLTNTLEEARDNVETMMAQWLSKEAQAANEIKSDTPVMVILGNPPYSGHSANTGAWINNLLRGIGDQSNYFQVDDKPLNERNPKWLNDDYVKFIRFAQWRISQTGYGVLGFVTNHGYLDNPTFRGMRQALLHTFDEIYILDLHGNSKKKEKAPDGGADNNVFDIQQGVAIGIFIKHKAPTDFENQSGLARIHHAHVYGKRSLKYQYLMEKDINTTTWTELTPQAPFYLFVPQNIDLFAEYQKYWKITEIMPVNSVGIVTARDSLTIQYSQQDVMQIISDFVRAEPEIARIKYHLGKDTRDWKVKLAQDDIKESGIDKNKIVPVCYRPFDKRFTLYTGKTRGFICMPRPEIMQHMLHEKNYGLITVRQVAEGIFTHSFVSNEIIDFRTTLSNKGGGYIFPIYLYPSEQDHFLNGNGNSNGNSNGAKKEVSRKPNFSDDFIKDLASKLKLKFISEGRGDFTETVSALDVFYYMYAVLHCPSYRTRYAEFLKMDFPRVPLTSETTLFSTLTNLGEQLVHIHLMEATLEDIAGYPIEGSNVVDKIAYEKQRIYINKTQYFEPVESEIWEFHIGGYQVAHKWLKDRKGRALSNEDLEHYLYILAALKRTLELMQSIDEAIPEFPVI